MHPCQHALFSFPTRCFLHLQIFTLALNSSVLPDHEMDSGSTADLLAAQSSDANDPLQDLVFRRVRYDTNCRHIAEQRDDRYRKFSIDDLIPLAFYTTSTELQNFRNLNLVAQIALQKYQSEKPDFFSDWQKYCKALSGRLRAVATFGTSAFVPLSTKTDPFVEGAIYLAAKVVPEPERQAWVDQCLNQLSSLKHLIPANEGGRTGRKRKRSGKELQVYVSNTVD